MDAVKEEKVVELGRELEQMKKQLKEERNKVQDKFGAEPAMNVNIMLGLWHFRVENTTCEYKWSAERGKETVCIRIAETVVKYTIHRLCRKAEELENLVNAEATDIEEVLNMINGLQVTIKIFCLILFIGLFICLLSGPEYQRKKKRFWSQ